MSKHIAFIVIEDFADWEHGLLSAGLRAYFGGATSFHTPGGGDVTSSGGLKVRPHGAIEALDSQDYDALVVIGSSIWARPDAPDVAAALKAADDAGKVVAAICAGTLAAGRAGLLAERRHTSNSLEFLLSGAEGYAGSAYYAETPRAVRDGRLITAPGSAPATFAAEVLSALFPEQGEAIAGFEAMCAAEHQVQ